MSVSANPMGMAAGVDQVLNGLIEHYAGRMEKGESLDVEACARAHPEYAEQLRKLLPTMQVLADLGHSADASTGQEAPVGAGRGAVGTLGDFRILAEIGRGGMGIVYEAEQISLGRRVALKVLPFAGTMDARQLLRFQNEARAAACLHHRHIVPVYAVGCERGVNYYAMHLIAGQSLAALIQSMRKEQAPQPPPEEAATVAAPIPGKAKSETLREPRAQASTLKSSKRGRDDWRRLAELARQAADALEHAHQSGVVHRDVKPGNLLLDQDGNLWIADFGLAQVQTDSRLTMTGDLVGTLRYMSPEQALAKRVLIDHRTDIYSLGATLYELLTLEPVFNGGDRQELLRQIAFEDPKPLRAHNQAVPAELETIVLKALEKNPADRYATAQELADDLERFVKDEPIKARRPSLARRLKTWCRRHKVVAASLVAIVVTALLFGGAVLWSGQRQRAATELAVAEDLKEAETWQRAEQWAKAMQALERATARLQGGNLGSLRIQVDERRREVALVARLEEIPLQATGTIPDFQSEWVAAERAYAAAFAACNLVPGRLSPEEFGQRIRVSGIRVQLVTALDSWAHFKETLHAGDGKPLSALAQLADDDPWRQKLRDLQLSKDRPALELLAEGENVLNQPPTNLLILSRALERLNALKAAVGLMRRAQRRYPADFWMNFQLAWVLHLDSIKTPDPIAVEEKVGFVRAALALQPKSPFVYEFLGIILDRQNKLPEAIEAYRKAIEIKPDSVTAYYNLGVALTKEHNLPEAIEAFNKAITLKTSFAEAYNGLGVALNERGNLVEAIDAYRKAIALRPAYTDAFVNLGNTFSDCEKLPEAIDAYHKAIFHDPGSAEAYYNFGYTLGKLHKLPESGDAFRQAIRINPKYAMAYCELGITLGKQEKLSDAEAAFREAVKLEPDYAIGHLNLGMALASQGKLREAENAFRTVIGLFQPGPTYEGRYNHLPRHLRDKARLPEALCFLAETLRLQRQYVASLRYYSETFQTDPTLMEETADGQHRYNAACAAAMAGCGKGDAVNLDAKEYSRLRGQSLTWLRAELDSWDSKLQRNPDKIGSEVRKRMQHWQHDTDFDGVRDAKALAKLPEAECREWQALWDKVAELERRAGEAKKAIGVQPDDVGASISRSYALRDQQKLPESVARKAIALQPDNAVAYYALGNALYKQQKLPEAVTAYRKAIDLKPDLAVAYSNLGNALHAQHKMSEAVAAYRKAIDLKPDLPEPYFNLGNILHAQHKVPEAVAAYRNAIELKPDYVEAYSNLGNALRAEHKMSEAVAAYRKAVEFKPASAEAYCDLGAGLAAQRKLPEAVVAYRKAIDLKPAYAEAYYNLGNAMNAQHKLPEAVTAYRKAIDLKPDLAEAHCNLGLVLQQQGLFVDSLTSLRRGHELGTRSAHWPYPSAEWVRKADQNVWLEAKLPKVLSRETMPADATERVALASFCRQSYKQFYRASARFFSEAFAAEPQLANDLLARNRYNAAGAAALAGCDQGKDVANFDAEARARLRRQALDWLRADLIAWENLFQKEPAKAPPVLRQVMQQWQHDADFDGVRHPKALAKLAEAERREWQAFWEQVAALERRAGEAK